MRLRFHSATRRLATIALVGTMAAMGACKEVNVPNLNSPNIDQLLAAPKASVVNTTVLGLLVGARGTIGGYASTLGVFGRESYNLDQAEARFVLAWLAQPLTPGGFGTDLGWSATYQQVLAAQTILDIVDKVPDYSAAQKEAVKGFTKTFMAMAFIDQLRVRDTFGIVLEVDPTAKNLGAFVTRDQGFDRVAQLLDEARTHLNAGGTAFPFTMHSGFTGLSTPATFLRFNRAIKARAEVYRGRWQDALTAINESFISTTSPTTATLATGAYHVFSASAGDATNGLFDPAPRALVAHPSILTDAQLRANGQPDLRTSKVTTGATLSNQGITSNLRFTIYPTNVSSIPIIKNEELILLRAEAYNGLGNRAAAIADLNIIRTVSGGLAPLADTFDGDLVTEILYNRRYSLLFEYGHRWHDMRRYGRLNQLPKALPSHLVYPLVPLPADECNQRSPLPKGCVQVNGI
ncbi:MAG: RagB/SusD family nutrient uptake outer membrane protein [Gemmatimonadaceae bacterium]|nr:RagB/SusD family nutrient uptake outer membrane protein [Gemmatimonadaceae bacterium]